MTKRGLVQAVEGIDLDVGRGETVSLVGESGSGKSLTALSVMRLVELESEAVLSGEVWLEGQELLAKPQSEMRRLRGSAVAMVFQEPMTALNPVLGIGRQLAQVLHYHGRSSSRSQARSIAAESLAAVGIADPAATMRRYPHQLSGGMRQRVVIAMALLARPSLLIADEPTTALDVTTQAQVLELMQRLQSENGMGLLLITHDMGVAAQVADRVAVMYAGRIVEQGAATDIFGGPLHPYTRGLLGSVPTLDGPRRRHLVTIPGSVPAPGTHPTSCAFSPRCPLATEVCRSERPPQAVLDGRRVECWHARQTAA
ncbi:MAG: ABC transporter ATP-binding protein [Actinomycetota bacterium]|nr:ABC transporter ATP-binding protein [Actinomycetota bacterium]